MYPESVKNSTNQSRVSEAGKIWNLRLLYRNGKDSLIFKNRFLIFLYYMISKKERIKQEIESVCTLDIRIKQ